MQEGRILAASQDGAYVIRLSGDVRVNLCATIEDYLQDMYRDPSFTTVWLDLCDAEGVDSTTLGVLAKLSLSVQEKFGFKPVLYANDPGIVRLLHSMSMHNLFEMHEEVCSNPEDIRSLPAVESSPDTLKATVVDAHRVLMNLSDENRKRFQDLMRTLDRS